MSTAILEKYPLPAAAPEIDELIESDDLESLECALAELGSKLSGHAQAKQAMSERWWQLTHGAIEVRRRRVRASIILVPPVTFYSILYDHEPSER